MNGQSRAESHTGQDLLLVYALARSATVKGMTRQPDPVAHAEHTASTWLAAVADELRTDDEHYTYQVLRAWLHTVRDWLPVDSAAHLTAQLPALLRGIYYEGWTPSRVPARYDASEFTERFAHAAGISPSDVNVAATAVTRALHGLFSAGQLDHALSQLPQPILTKLTKPARAVHQRRFTRSSGSGARRFPGTQRQQRSLYAMRPGPRELNRRFESCLAPPRLLRHLAPARGVLCVPDFIANARGVICAALLDRTADMPRTPPPSRWPAHGSTSPGACDAASEPGRTARRSHDRNTAERCFCRRAHRPSRRSRVTNP